MMDYFSNKPCGFCGKLKPIFSYCTCPQAEAAMKEHEAMNREWHNQISKVRPAMLRVDETGKVQIEVKPMTATECEGRLHRLKNIFPLPEFDWQKCVFVSKLDEPILTTLKEAIAACPEDQQQALYEWMHNTLGRRIYK